MSTATCLTGDRAAIDAFIERFDTFLFDCDGVIWQQGTRKVFDGVPDVLNMLKAKGKQVIFVTNASNIVRTDMADRLRSVGVQCTPEDMYTSGYSAALYIKNVMALPAGHDRVFLIGQKPIRDELEMMGIPVCGGRDTANNRSMTNEDFEGITNGSALESDVGVVLFCWDDVPSILKYNLAFAYLQRGARFLLSNADIKCAEVAPDGSRCYFLANGSMAAPLTAGTGIMPESLGKPSPAMLSAVESKVKIDRSRTCMIGDNLDTDIRFGISSGLGSTLAVLTGVLQKEDFLALGAPTVPSFYIDSVASLGL